MEDLSRDWAAWRLDHETVWQESDLQTRTTTVFASVSEQPPKDPFSLLIGDVLHNLRSTLDLLAFGLAVANLGEPLPEDVAENSEFPIFGGKDAARRFAKARQRKIGGMHPDAQAIIERVQPYHRGHDYRLHPLWVLHDLDRIDKHRLLHLCVASFKGAEFDEAGLGRVEGDLFVFENVVETKTPVAKYRFTPRVAGDNVYVEVTPSLEIALVSPLSGHDREPIRPLLREVAFYITNEVTTPLGPFL